MAFLEEPRFSDCISQGSSGGPMYSTNIVELSSGHEARNQNWINTRYEYDVGYGIAKIEDLEIVLDYFHVSLGKLNGFRFKDWLDYKSCSVTETPSPFDQVIGVGNGAQTAFQLIKRYEVGVVGHNRDIVKPVKGEPSTVRVAVDGIEKTETTDFTVDYTTGIITFLVAPASGNVTAGYEFDVPVRFDVDSLPFTLDTFYAGNTSIPLVELKDP